MKVKIKTPGDEKKAGQALSEIPEVQEVHYVAGEDAFLVKVRVADPEDLGRLTRDKIAAVATVQSTQTAIVLSTYKETARIPIDNVD